MNDIIVNDLDSTIVELKVLIMDLNVDNDLIVMSAFMLTNSDLLVETNYGPLFLDEYDFKQFNFDPYWVAENYYNNDDVKQLMTKIKIDYINQLIEQLKKGEISYEDIM